MNDEIAPGNRVCQIILCVLSELGGEDLIRNLILGPKKYPGPRRG